MSVTVVQEKNPLNTVGGLMTLGGTLIPGAGLLAPLGLGMSAATGETTGYQNMVLGKIMENIMNGGNGWKNPASGSMGETTAAQSLSDEELARKWSPYLNRG